MSANLAAAIPIYIVEVGRYRFDPLDDEEG
jgi:hypothetical protein